LFLHPFFTHP